MNIKKCPKIDVALRISPTSEATKRLIAGLVLALGVALSLAVPPEANADADYFVRTEVAWTGAPCIAIYQAWSGETRTYCGGHASFTEGNVWPGDQIGVDPIMGAASYIECKLFINGVLSWSDAAVRGDGSDVSCSRVKT